MPKLSSIWAFVGLGLTEILLGCAYAPLSAKRDEILLACRRGSLGRAEDPGGKHHKHHKVQEWLSLLSDEDRAKLRAAKEQAAKDPAVQAANRRRKQAEAEYRELLHKEMLKADPSRKPLLNTITDLKKHDDDE